MDPLSITASIIAALQAASAIISTAYSIKAAMKDVPITVLSIISDIIELRNVLETLDRLAYEDPKDDPNSHLSSKQRRSFEMLSNPHGPLEICQQELKTLEALIDDRSGSRRGALVQALRWQYGGDEIRMSLKRIERIKSTLNLAITADSAALLLNIQEMVTDIATVVETVQIRELNETQKKILRWLSPVDPSASHEAATRIHQAGTNDWFLHGSEFQNWYAAKRSFLWLSGLPGAGKTILLSSTVTYLRERAASDDLIAWFYCDFRKKETEELINVLGCLISQSCTQSGMFPPALKDAYQKTHSKSDKPNLQLLRQLLEIFAARFRLFLLIDGLDECAQPEQAIDFICDLQKSNIAINLLLTSRDVQTVQGLDEFVHVKIEAHQREVSQDVKLYLDNRLISDKRLQWLNKKSHDSLREDIANQLMERSAGMFRYCQCAIDAIASLRTVRAIRTALRELPRGLDETYDNILLKIPEPDTETVRRILMWVAFATMPMTLGEVYEAIAIDADLGLDHLDEESRLRTPADILDLCGSLVVVSEDGHIGLAHLSVKEYLLSPRTKRNHAVSAFALEPERAVQELAKNCLAYLCFREFSTGPCKTSETFDERLIRLPLATYAAVAWPYFVRSSKTPELQQRINEFFQPPASPIFMSWVQVLNAIHGSWNFYPNPTTTLYYASTFGLTEAVAALLLNPEVISVINDPGSRFGGTALHGATLREKLPAMKLLLRAGADPNQADWNKISPLHTAAGYGNKDVIQLLLEHGASRDALDYENQTPFDCAVRANNPVSISLLARDTKTQGNPTFQPSQRSSASGDKDGSDEHIVSSPTDVQQQSKRGTRTSSSRITFLMNQGKIARQDESP
ncbi:hypothetical protein LTR84_009674 [Exophiala bonariae]|uniref:NACHT domain-containing protein n=1 Tax=Exophiala bonariae TaxID=1690606 RepID=A0AAV9NMP1_9EURO|nr:hypothetical protein LTR84_009674 [Exophiala bonariae]